MSVTLNGTNGLTFNDGSSQATAATGFGFKNRIINGAMVIDQRNAGASVTPTNTAAGTYTLDRWAAYISAASKFSVQQNAGSVTPPAGFTKYLGVTSLSAYSIGSSDYFFVSQAVEGLNASDLAWGTANAASVTLSFRVYSSLTGTFGGSLRNGNGTRNYPFSFSVGTANTWTTVSIQIAGDTSGTWATDNTAAITVAFGLGVGSTLSGTAGAWAAGNIISATGATSVVGTNGATFYITGVQLEKGSTATNFDYRPYGTELALCQRYYYKLFPNATANPFGLAFVATTSLTFGHTQLPVTMRIAPTALEQSGTANQYAVATGAISTVCTSVPSFGTANVNIARTTFTTGATLTVGQAAEIRTDGTNGANAYLAWSAEL